VAAGEVVALAPADYMGFLHRQQSAGIAGGRIYDALIAETARGAGAEVLLTFNTRHFEGFEGLEVDVPSSTL
jgi:predicted nucleic acid-binding protein